jgi:hypothetical protein
VVHAGGGVPAGRAQLGARLPVPSHGPSPQVTRLPAANADPGRGGSRRAICGSPLAQEGSQVSNCEILKGGPVHSEHRRERAVILSLELLMTVREAG